MRFQITSLSAPSDPVVAVHRSRSEADAAMHALTQVGFGSDMLELVGRRGDCPILPSELAKPMAHPWHGATPGLLLGALWASFIVATTLAFPANVPTLLVMGILVLSLQAVLVRQVARPLAGLTHPAAPSGSQPPGDTTEGSAWRFLLLVHGSRSEVALARDVLSI